MNIGGAAMIRRPFLRAISAEAAAPEKAGSPKRAFGDYDYAYGFLCSLAPLWLISFLVRLCSRQQWE
jgi:hypothetical protein